MAYQKETMDASEGDRDRGKDRRVRSFQTTWLGMSQLRSPPVETVETQATPFFAFFPSPVVNGNCVNTT
jgi:hypothetical protein